MQTAVIAEGNGGLFPTQGTLDEPGRGRLPVA
jgi:hypothetical protein